jgi:hypothetical protein
MDNLEEIKNYTINRGFPELIGSVVITADYKSMEDSYFEMDRLRKKEYHINADNSLINAGNKVIIGGLAHELAHISKDFNKNWLANEIDSWLYSLSARYETWDERRADALAIKKGFGKELLAFLDYANERGEVYNKKDGLTAEEIRRILNSR